MSLNKQIHVLQIMYIVFGLVLIRKSSQLHSYKFYSRKIRNKKVSSLYQYCLSDVFSFFFFIKSIFGSIPLSLVLSFSKFSKKVGRIYTQICTQDRLLSRWMPALDSDIRMLYKNLCTYFNSNSVKQISEYQSKHLLEIHIVIKKE